MAAHRLTQAATDDIETIFIAGLAIFGLARADRYHVGLTAAFEFLAEFPRAARIREEINPAVRAFRFKSHMIIYDLADGDGVITLRVRHGHEDWIPHADEN